MLGFFKEYFSYTKSEKRGIIVLVVLIIAVFIAPPIIKLFNSNTEVDFSEFESKISQFEEISNQSNVPVKDKAIKPFEFDPNKISKSDMIKLGLNGKQANNIINYRNAGGKFKHASDLSKIYTIDAELFNKLKPFVKIKSAETNYSISQAPKQQEQTYLPTEKSTRTEASSLRIELNSSDSIDLIKLNGIGVVLAKRIVLFRNYLGGYYNKKQILEVYGIEMDLFSTLEENIFVDTLKIQKINLNKVDFKTLNKHPYISYAQTKTLLKYRELMGAYKSLDEIEENNLLDSVTSNRINPYLTVQ